jgi:hypothetical protein
MGESLDLQSLEGLGGTRGILAHRTRDRIDLDRLVHRVDVSTGDRRRKHLKQPCRLIFPDAIIGEPVSRPPIRRRIPDGEQLRFEIERGHQGICERFSSLDGLRNDDPRRQCLWERIETPVRGNVRDEDSRLLPILQQRASRWTFIQLGSTCEAVRQTARTRPHPVVARQPLGNVAAAVSLTLNDRSRKIVDRAARRLRGSTRTGCQPVGAGLARFAGAVEHMPAVTGGGDPSTRARVHARGCELTVDSAAQGHSHALSLPSGS